MVGVQDVLKCCGSVVAIQYNSYTLGLYVLGSLDPRLAFGGESETAISMFVECASMGVANQIVDLVLLFGLGHVT